MLLHFLCQDWILKLSKFWNSNGFLNSRNLINRLRNAFLAHINTWSMQCFVICVTWVYILIRHCQRCILQHIYTCTYTSLPWFWVIEHYWPLVSAFQYQELGQIYILCTNSSWLETSGRSSCIRTFGRKLKTSYHANEPSLMRPTSYTYALSYSKRF